ncbi:MAG: hypothetical protein QXQ14_00095 [Candidatus Aenigmatarchaeota archaeon]
MVLKASAFITYLILFFSMLFISIILIYGFQIILFFFLKRSWFESKLAAETIASILNNIFSSSYNVSLIIKLPPKNLKINIYSENVTVSLEKNFYASKLFKPSYIKLKETSLECIENLICNIFISKVNDEISIT